MTPQSRSGTHGRRSLRALGRVALALFLSLSCGALAFLAAARQSSSPFVVFVATTAAMTVLPVMLVGRDFRRRRWMLASMRASAASSLPVAAAFAATQAGLADREVPLP